MVAAVSLETQVLHDVTSQKTVLLVAGNCGRGRGVIPSLAGPGEQS
jgi:hypothetical protein